MIEVFDPHAFPVHLPLLVASTVFDPEKPASGVAFRFCGVSVKFQKDGFSRFVKKPVHGKFNNLQIGRRQVVAIMSGPEDFASEFTSVGHMKLR